VNDLSSALSDAHQAMENARTSMRKMRAVMRLQSRAIRRERRLRNLACGVSFAQSASAVALLLSSCDVYQEPIIEQTPICTIVIDHVHGTSETSGDCDAGEW